MPGARARAGRGSRGGRGRGRTGARAAGGGQRVTLVEIDPGLAALAAENAQANGLAARVSAVVLDVAAPARAFAAAGLAPETVDARPDESAVQRSGAAARIARPSAPPCPCRPGWDARRLDQDRCPAAASAWHAHPDLASGWSRRCPASARRRLRRGDGVPDPFQGRRARDPRPGARGEGQPRPLALLPGLVLNDAAGVPTAQAEAVLRGGAVLPLAQI